MKLTYTSSTGNKGIGNSLTDIEENTNEIRNLKKWIKNLVFLGAFFGTIIIILLVFFIANYDWIARIVIHYMRC